MKVLILEYLPFDTLAKWFTKNGLNIIDEETNNAINNVPKEKMITIYKQIFKSIYELLDNNIFPYDTENLSNYLINPKTLEVIIIDP